MFPEVKKGELLLIEGAKGMRRRKLKKRWSRFWQPNKLYCPCKTSKRCMALIWLMSFLNIAFGAVIWFFGWLSLSWTVATSAGTFLVISVTLVLMSKKGVEKRAHFSNCPHQRASELSSRR